MFNKNAGNVNRILLGLLMLGAGLVKLFVFKASGVAASVTGTISLFAWSPTFWAWVLILSEIVFGIAILLKWRLQYSVWPPIVIMLIAGFTNWPSEWSKLSLLLMHLVIASNYFMLGVNHMKASK